MSVGFHSELDGMEFQNGQGIVGATMLSGKATAVEDLSADSDLVAPFDGAASKVVGVKLRRMRASGRGSWTRRVGFAGWSSRS